MSQPLIVSIPHRLGRQEARRRLDRGIGRLEGELGALLSGLDHHWQEDTLNFTASAIWQRITGRIEVMDDAVRVRAARKATRRGVGNCLLRRSGQQSSGLS